MPQEILELLNAPWATVLTLAAGYAGYFVAHVGAREHHQPLDQMFRVVLYGFWGVFAYMMARSHAGAGILSASLLAMGVTVLFGAVWRRWGRQCLTRGLRAARVTHSDDLPSAWAALFETGNAVIMTQLRVTLLDGTVLFCNDLAQFKDQPDGPCVLGASGDVLMYVTSIGRRGPDGKLLWTPAELTVDDYGVAMITYVPRDQIARIGSRRSARKAG